MDSPLVVKSKAFALAIIRVCNQIKKEQKESILTNQLIRSGTSVGANIREAFYAHGRADFIAKLHIALKECTESEYWLELSIESGHWSDGAIPEQCTEVKKLLISSINTAKSNLTQQHLSKCSPIIPNASAFGIFFFRFSLFLPRCLCYNSIKTNWEESLWIIFRKSPYRSWASTPALPLPRNGC